jgi:hypothetical protein
MTITVMYCEINTLLALIVGTFRSLRSERSLARPTKAVQWSHVLAQFEGRRNIRSVQRRASITSNHLTLQQLQPLNRHHLIPYRCLRSRLFRKGSVGRHSRRYQENYEAVLHTCVEQADLQRVEVVEAFEA